MLHWKRRQFSLLFHRYLGAIAGLLFILVGLTGSFLVFSEEIDHFLHPHLLQVQPNQESIPPGKAVEIAQNAYPDFKPHRITVPQSSEQVYTVMLVSPDDEYTDVYLDPHAGEILGSRPWKQTLVGFLIDLHVHLLAGDWGMQIVGMVGIALLGMGITGLVLWRGWRNWPQAFRIRWRSPRSFLAYDLHKVAGALSVIWLMLIAFTGVMMIFWTPFENTVYWLTGESKPPAIIAAKSDRSPMAIDVLLEKARSAYPEAKLWKFYPPKRSGDFLQVWSRFPHENPFNRDLHLSLDPDSGAIARVEDSRKASLATRLVNAQYILHIGHYGGLLTRWLYAIVGLVPIALMMTGWMLWQKRRWNAARQRVIRQPIESGRGEK